MDMGSIAAVVTAGVANAATTSAAFIQSQAMLVLAFLGFAQSTFVVQLAVLAALVIVPVALVVGIVILVRHSCEEEDEPDPLLKPSEVDKGIDDFLKRNTSFIKRMEKKHLNQRGNQAHLNPENNSGNNAAQQPSDASSNEPKAGSSSSKPKT